MAFVNEPGNSGVCAPQRAYGDITAVAIQPVMAPHIPIAEATVVHQEVIPTAVMSASDATEKMQA